MSGLGKPCVGWVRGGVTDFLGGWRSYSGVAGTGFHPGKVTGLNPSHTIRRDYGGLFAQDIL